MLHCAAFVVTGDSFCGPQSGTSDSFSGPQSGNMATYSGPKSGTGDSFCGPLSGTGDPFPETYSTSFTAVEAYLKQKMSPDLILT